MSTTPNPIRLLCKSGMVQYFKSVNHLLVVYNLRGNCYRIEGDALIHKGDRRTIGLVEGL